MADHVREHHSDVTLASHENGTPGWTKSGPNGANPQASEGADRDNRPDTDTNSGDPAEEQAAPVDCQAVVTRRERELKTVGEARHRAEAAVERVRERCQAVRDRVGPSGMINASQILGLLSPTWPDGNHEAPAPGTAPDEPNEQYRFATTWAEYHAGRKALDEPKES
jgi:hypothetical protein